MNECVNLKQKIDRTLYCKKKKRIITLSDCKCCDSKIFKLNKKANTLKKISFSLTEQQKRRFSIINRPMNKCAECKSKIGVERNEVFEGAKRVASMKYGFVVPLCRKCHDRFHNDREFALKYKRLYQEKFEESHSREEFLKLVHRNYL
jgi:hypothetical protein